MEQTLKSLGPQLPECSWMDANLKCPEGTHPFPPSLSNNNNKIYPSKLQSIFTRPVSNEHNPQLTSQGWWMRIYFLFVSNGLVKKCLCHSASTSEQEWSREELQTLLSRFHMGWASKSFTWGVPRWVLGSVIGYKSMEARWEEVYV